jgi:uncharacterized protein YkwD
MWGRLTVLAACVLFTMCPGAQAADDPYAALLAPSGTCGAAADQLGLDQATAQQTMQCLTNYARTRSGLGPLQLNAKLNEAGNAKLAADVSCREFSHTPCGQPFATVFADYLKGVSSYQIGENIAWGTGKYGTPRETMSGWLHSTGHRENILTPEFTEIGIGYLAGQTFEGYNGATLWSQEFGRTDRPSSTATTTTAPAAKPAPEPVKKLLRRKHRRSVRAHR